MFCFGCGNTIEKSTERRRLLGESDSSKRVLAAWKSICMKVSNKSEEELDRIAKSPGRVCRYYIYSYYVEEMIINHL